MSDKNYELNDFRKPKEQNSGQKAFSQFWKYKPKPPS